MNKFLAFTFRLVTIGCLCFFTSSGWADEGGENHQPLLSELLDKAACNHPKIIQKIKNEYPAFIEYSDQQIQLINSGAQQPQISLGEDLLEVAKFTGMGTLAAVLYGITHDLITTHIDFRYFSDLFMTHHGRYTKRHYPFVYRSESKILYALLWGTIATWRLGAIMGGTTGVVARAGPSHKKPGWHDLMPTLSKLMLGSLIASASYGFITYIGSSDTFITVANMHGFSYVSGVFVGIAIMAYAHHLYSNEALPSLRTECIGFTKTLTKLFKDKPNDPEIQALILFRLNSPIKNCEPG
ncbi:hypothetical protein [Endozoicomonas euniceicola]|uniref:Uncharacterized protein n=1 Tax=Endozoicomonas euniceicola TaxID=1234143 RepID=A0ABY6GMY4_9GAMM|nr:hypothetical protein [Endozoicomonas euniceicola]UYM13995.1 hypothetical protein NX720_13845 [Endozoicomonas euniceicola]